MIEVRQTDRKRLFLRGPSPGARLFLLLVLSLSLMVIDYRFGHLDSIRQILSVVVYPVRAVVNSPFDAFDDISDGLRQHHTLREENASLREQYLLANVKLQKFESLEAENARLRALMESTSKVADRVLVSEILKVDLDPNRHRIALNKGIRHGAFQGQALLDAQGIVGQITHAGPLTSEAILISDPDHAVPVEVIRNGLRTIAVGTGDINIISLPFLPNNADIKDGDVLVTSGMGGSFPRGYPLGIVSAVKRDPHQPFAAINATPAAALNRDREVLLVWPGEPQIPIEKQRDARLTGAADSPVGGRPR